jgi:GTP cyclohydrolase II
MRELKVVKLGESPLKTKYGVFHFSAWYDGHSEAYVLRKGVLSKKDGVPVRVHSSCVTAHYFNSTECDCREQIELAQQIICGARLGLIIVLNQQAKANGILATLNYKGATSNDAYSAGAYEVLGYPRDARRYLTAASIIKAMRIKSILLLTNSKDKQLQLEQGGVIVVARREILVDTALRPDLLAHYAGKKDEEGHEIPSNKVASANR